MCNICKGKDKKCFCRSKITTSDNKLPRYIKGKIANQKGAFGRGLCQI